MTLSPTIATMFTSQLIFDILHDLKMQLTKLIIANKKSIDNRIIMHVHPKHPHSSKSGIDEKMLQVNGHKTNS